MADAITAVVVRLQNSIASLRDSEEGQGFVEYVVLIALIALGLFAAIILFRDELGEVFGRITNTIQNELPG